jgi:ribosomal protein S18 acetylase RimI-like enzyme
MNVFLANADYLEPLAILFDHYRVFYGQLSDLDAARAFLGERFEQKDSTLFAAHDGETIVGFTQLYPSFSSVSMKRIWILNDLYVKESFRRGGVATLLMDAAETYARQSGAIRVVLSTQISNKTAQTLYESRGYNCDETFYHYTLSFS